MVIYLSSTAILSGVAWLEQHRQYVVSGVGVQLRVQLRLRQTVVGELDTNLRQKLNEERSV